MKLRDWNEIDDVTKGEILLHLLDMAEEQAKACDAFRATEGSTPVLQQRFKQRADGYLAAAARLGMVNAKGAVESDDAAAARLPRPGHGWNDLGDRWCPGDHPKNDHCDAHAIEVDQQAAAEERVRRRNARTVNTVPDPLKCDTCGRECYTKCPVCDNDE